MVKMLKEKDGLLSLIQTYDIRPIQFILYEGMYNTEIETNRYHKTSDTTFVEVF